MKNLIAIFLGCLLALVLLEGLLRIYNPIPTRIKGDKIVLPANYRSIISFGGRANIVYSKNSRGLRGPDLPTEPEIYYKILAVGGSTTECMLVSDGEDWPARLGSLLTQDSNRIWVNNAGLDGHSTYGHRILLEDHLLSLAPDMILFLVGANDVGREDLGINDAREMVGNYHSPMNFLAKHTEVGSLAKNLVLTWRAFASSRNHRPLPPYPSTADTLQIPPGKAKMILDNHRRSGLLDAYRSRLMYLISTCKSHNIKPVLITQPTLVGTGKDSLTGLDLEKVRIYSQSNGKMSASILELYNDVTREVARNTQTQLIDLYLAMPRSTRYFYDYYHFTSEGCAHVAQIVYDQLAKDNAIPCRVDQNQ